MDADSPEQADKARYDFITVPPIQPPPDSRLVDAAKEVHRAIRSTVDFLCGLGTLPTEREKCLWTWYTALSVLSWDVGSEALPTSISGSLRAARILNRALFEYAIRAHYYLAKPQQAEQHIAEARNMVKRVVNPLLTHPESDDGVAAARSLFGALSTDAQQPKTAKMLGATLDNVLVENAQRGLFKAHLESEYALGTAYSHGSQSAFLDIFDRRVGAEDLVHFRTRVLHRPAELIRSATSMLLLISAVEKQYHADLSGNARATLAALAPLSPSQTTLGTHDAVIMLLGLR